MSVPAWKQAILDRKRKAEEAQKKKEEEEAAYLASLPPWKRALVKKQREQAGGASTLERKESKEKSNEPPSNKWMTAVQQARENSPKLSNRSTWTKRNEPSHSQPAKESPSSYSSTGTKPLTRPSANSFSGTLSAFSNKTSTTTPKPASNYNSLSGFKSAATPRASNALTSSMIGSKTRREDQAANISTSPPKEAPSPASQGVSLRQKDKQPSPNVVSIKRRSFEGDEDDEAKLAAMPAWKKALILRRRAAAAQPSKEPRPQMNREPLKTNQSQSTRETANTLLKQTKQEPVNTVTKNKSSKVSAYKPSAQIENVSQGDDEIDFPHKQSSSSNQYANHTPTKPSSLKSTKDVRGTRENKSKTREEQKTTPTASPPVKSPTPASKSPSAKPIVTKKAPSQPNKVTKHQPEIVNRPRADATGSTKLVEQEGVVHRPPAYKVVDEWANVSEDDPRFKKLPLWKQALIKRRRNDYAKRSAAIPAESPKGQKISFTTSFISTQPTPTWNSGQSNSEDTNKSTTNRFTSTNNNKLQPVRKAPGRPAPAPPPKQEEPMFTFSFSKHRTLDAGSDSEDSDSDLEDVTVTNLDDDDVSDEDSGIDKGGIIVTSYKVINTEYTESDNQTTMVPTNNESGGMKRSESTSILKDPAKKTSRVSNL